MARTISASVGRMGGINLPPDVTTVQQLLNKVPPSSGGPAPPLPVNGSCGPETISAIQTFQLRHFGWHGADGRVDPNGPTLAKLNEFDTPLPPAPPPPDPKKDKPPVEPEPLSRTFSIRGTCRFVNEPPDASDVTVGTNGLEVPDCFQVFDVTNKRKALYTANWDGQYEGGLWGPAKFPRSPRVFRTHRPLPLSGLNCKAIYKTTVYLEDGMPVRHISRLELRLPGGTVGAPMFIHIDSGEIGTRTGHYIDFYRGTFEFRQFGHHVGGITGDPAR